MTWDELISAELTWNDLSNLTLGHLSGSTSELLEKASRNEISLPDSTWKKLQSLCNKAIEDCRGVLPDDAIPASVPITNGSKPLNITEKVALVLALSTILSNVGNFITSISPSTTTNITYNITSEQVVIIKDVQDIISTVSNAQCNLASKQE